MEHQNLIAVEQPDFITLESSKLIAWEELN